MSGAAILLGRPTDPHLQALAEELPRLGLEPRTLDPRRFPARASLSIALDGARGPKIATTLADFDDARVGWFRSQESVRLSGALAPAARRFARAASIAGLVSLRHASGIRWVNDPWRALASADKLWQLVLARGRGLTIPATLVTNDPDDFARFVRARRKAAVKSPSGSHGLPDDKRVLTQLVTPRDLSDVATIRHAPVMAQEYVAKRTELRVTVVGTKAFAVEIHSQETERTRVDWRRYDHRTRYDVAKLPARVERACVQVARDCGLDYSGIDLIRTPKDDYVFLEANSEPAWLWVEDFTGLPITQAIAGLLKRRGRAVMSSKR